MKITILTSETLSFEALQKINFIDTNNLFIHDKKLYVDFTMNEILFSLYLGSEFSLINIDLIQEAPSVDLTRCKRCGECVKACKNGAIVLEKSFGKIIIFPEKCTSCGKCYFFCSKKGLKTRKYKTGLIEILPLNEQTRIAQCFYKHLLLQSKQLIQSMLKAIEWKMDETNLYLLIKQEQWDERLQRMFNSPDVKTI